jgi:hypothetical protein
MRSKRLDHLSVSGCLQMTLTGLTPQFMLLHGYVVEGRESIIKDDDRKFVCLVAYIS